MFCSPSKEFVLALLWIRWVIQICFDKEWLTILKCTNESGRNSWLHLCISGCGLEQSAPTLHSLSGCTGLRLVEIHLERGHVRENWTVTSYNPRAFTFFQSFFLRIIFCKVLKKTWKQEFPTGWIKYYLILILCTIKFLKLQSAVHEYVTTADFKCVFGPKIRTQECSFSI